MYACSTTTYQGFQCRVSEEESEMFKGLPGVVYVLPDSYIDAVNKEYGGDKYDNGVITPRPPPMRYGKQGGRYGDCNKDFNRNPQMPNDRGDQRYDKQGPRPADNKFYGPDGTKVSEADSEADPETDSVEADSGTDSVEADSWTDSETYSEEADSETDYEADYDSLISDKDEGDYNLCLITMDFPKDNPPTRDEMIGTYLQTLAKVVGSYKEARKKMYAFSTTTYQGFKCLVSEEESKMFEGLPGVVSVETKSDINIVNKEYGGDKYDHEVITPRPPPVQHGRQEGRYGDCTGDFNHNRQMSNDQKDQGYDNQGPRPADNRNFGQRHNPSVPYDNQGPRYVDNSNFGQQQNPQVPNQRPNPVFANQGYQVPNQQPNPEFSNKGPAYGDSWYFGRVQNPDVQPNYGPMGGEGRDPSPINSGPGARDYMPPYHGSSYNQNQQGYYKFQGERVPTPQSGYTRDNRNYAPPQGVTQAHGAGECFGQMGGGSIQGSGGNYEQMPGGNCGQGPGGNNSQGFNQHNYPGHGEEMSPMEQRNSVHGEQRSYGQVTLGFNSGSKSCLSESRCAALIKNVTIHMEFSK